MIMRPQPLRIPARKPLRLDDEVQFIRSLFERPLATGAVTPSGRILARTMARYVEPELPGPVVELGPGTGPLPEALFDLGFDRRGPFWGGFIPVFSFFCRP